VQKPTMKDTILVREAPKEPLPDSDWNEETIKRFKLEDWEVTELEEGNVVWRGETAFCLEAKED
jgi:hypothetical protein